MGVSGLQPFLLKTCPQVFKTLPERVRDCAGKTIVFDGTLVTQRFHFAGTPHPYRHVLGWFRTIQELRAANVKAICVFDGTQRSAAKKAETERRRAIRIVDTARASIEASRLQRLGNLNKALVTAQALSTTEREMVFATISSQQLGAVDVAASALTPSIAPQPTLPVEDVDIMTARSRPFTADDLADYSVGQVGVNVIEALSPELELDLSVEPMVDVGVIPDPTNSQVPPNQQEEPPTETFDVLSEEIDIVGQAANLPNPFPSSKSSFEDEMLRVQPPESVEAALSALGQSSTMVKCAIGEGIARVAPEASDPSKLASDIGALYKEFQRSVPTVQGIDAEERSTVVTGAETSPSDAQATATASKFQKALTLAEGKIWAALAHHASETPYAELACDAAALRDQSAHMSESYTRRTHPPTQKTYDECREILGALGIPCITTEGEYEAEALASSIVVHGHADFVASEDTDVLVYEAPLLRNITNRSGALTVVSGADVRASLGLDRSAFVDFALLLGTDFSPRIPNVGPARALKFIRTHGSIEAIVAAERKYAPRAPADAYLQQVTYARLVFDNLPPTPPPGALLPREPDEGAVERVLRKYGVQRSEYEWERTHAADSDAMGSSLGANYFGDQPSLRDSDFIAFEPFEPWR